MSKITIFASGNLFNIGGLQRSYALLTEFLVNNGHDVHVIAWWFDGDENAELAYPLDKRVKVHFFKQSFTSDGFNEITGLLEIIRPNVCLIVNSSQVGLFLLAAARHVGSKVVYSLRGSSNYCLKYLWPCIGMLNLVLLNSDAAHVLMPSYTDLFSDVIRKKIEVIPSQIAPAIHHAQPDVKNNNGRYVVLYSGRFSFEKRVDILIRAFGIIHKEFADWDLWLYGNGPLEDKLRMVVKELGVESRVVFGQASNTDDMYNVYPMTHIKVLPSEQEGCPMALREAMAHAIPVIAFKECSGSNEIITNGKDGLLLDSDDYVKRLADGMSYLMSEPRVRCKMGIKARNTADQYHPDAINKKWEQLLIDTINGNDKSLPGLNDKYHKEHDWASSLLSDLISKIKLRDVYIFDQDEQLFEQHKKEYLLIYGHRLFDKRFYLEEYYEVKKKGMDPLLHYLSEGYLLGHNPSPEFDTKEYRVRYLEQGSNVCPLYHFYKNGRFEGIKPITPVTDYYHKWPGRKPRAAYSVDADFVYEIKYLKKIGQYI